MAVAPHFSSFWCSVSCYGVVVSMFVLQVGDPGSNPGGSRLLEAISALLFVCVILIREGCGMWEATTRTCSDSFISDE